MNKWSAQFLVTCSVFALMSHAADTRALITSEGLPYTSKITFDVMPLELGSEGTIAVLEGEAFLLDPDDEHILHALHVGDTIPLNRRFLARPGTRITLSLSGQGQVLISAKGTGGGTWFIITEK